MEHASKLIAFLMTYFICRPKTFLDLSTRLIIVIFLSDDLQKITDHFLKLPSELSYIPLIIGVLSFWVLIYIIKKLGSVNDLSNFIEFIKIILKIKGNGK